MPFGIPKSKGGDSPENVKKMESCVAGIRGTNPRTGKPYTESEKIAICKSSLFGNDAKKSMAEKVVAIMANPEKRDGCIKLFADDAKIDKALAKRVLEMIYKTGLDADVMGRVLWRMKDLVMRKNVDKLMKKMKDQDIQDIIDGVAAEEERRTQISMTEDVKVWLFSELGDEFKEKEFKAKDMVTIQIMRTGEWEHPSYGKVKVTPETLKNVKKNFDNNERGVDLAVDENHEPMHRALGWFRELIIKDGNKLFAKIELTKKGAKLLTDGAYKYFSPEIFFVRKDEETGKIIKDLLIGGAFTNRPFFKAMAPLMANEGAASRSEVGGETNFSFLFLNQEKMEKITEFTLKVSGLGAAEKISKEEVDELQNIFNELTEDQQNDAKASLEQIQKKFEEGEKDEGGQGGDDKKEGDEGADDKGDEGDGDGGDNDEKDDEDEEKDDEKGNGGDNDGDGGKKDEIKEEGVEATEDGKVTMTTEKYKELTEAKELANKASKMMTEAVKKTCDAEFAQLTFSETNPKGVLLPKDAKAFSELAQGMSESKRDKLLELLKNLKSPQFGEIGADGKPVTSKKLSAKEQLQEKADEIAKEKGISKEQAFSEAVSQNLDLAQKVEDERREKMGE